MSTMTAPTTHPTHLGTDSGYRTVAGERAYMDAPVGTMVDASEDGSHAALTKFAAGWRRTADGEHGDSVSPYHRRPLLRWGPEAALPVITEDVPVLCRVTANDMTISVINDTATGYESINPGESREVMVVRASSACSYTYLQAVRRTPETGDAGWGPDRDCGQVLQDARPDWRMAFIDNSATVEVLPLPGSTPTAPSIVVPQSPTTAEVADDGTTITIAPLPPKVSVPAASTPPRGSVVRVRMDGPADDMQCGSDYDPDSREYQTSRFPDGPWPREYDAIYRGPSSVDLLLTREQGKGWNHLDAPHNNHGGVPRTGWTVNRRFTLIADAAPAAPGTGPVVLDKTRTYTAEEVAALVTAEREQHLAFRKKTRDTAIAEGKTRGWCTEMDQVLVRVGLPPRVSKRVRIEYVTTSTISADLMLSEDDETEMNEAAQKYLRDNYGSGATVSKITLR